MILGSEYFLGKFEWCTYCAMRAVSQKKRAQKQPPMALFRVAHTFSFRYDDVFICLSYEFLYIGSSEYNTEQLDGWTRLAGGRVGITSGRSRQGGSSGGRDNRRMGKLPGGNAEQSPGLTELYGRRASPADWA